MGIAYRSTLGEPPTGNAVVGDVLYGKTFSNADGTDKVGTMPNNGAVAPTALDPGGSYTIPAGYHNGQGAVSAKSNTATYTASARGAALDMGAANLNRYVNTNGVPNSNSGTYTFPANDTGGTKDLGQTNSYRYVNAQNVYNKGKADGSNNFDSVSRDANTSPGVYSSNGSIMSPYAWRIGQGSTIWNGAKISVQINGSAIIIKTIVACHIKCSKILAGGSQEPDIDADYSAGQTIVNGNYYVTLVAY